MFAAAAALWDIERITMEAVVGNEEDRSEKGNTECNLI
jgi:hypothetical protein